MVSDCAIPHIQVSQIFSWSDPAGATKEGCWSRTLQCTVGARLHGARGKYRITAPAGLLTILLKRIADDDSNSDYRHYLIRLPLGGSMNDRALDGGED